jgi:putative glutamine amidotransferase
MTKPIIAITAGRILRPARQGELQLVATGCSTDYVEAVVRAGGAPLVIPRHSDEDAVRAVVAVADAILFTGGGDVCALAYGCEPHPSLGLQDPVRDAAEIAAARFALDKGMPVLGICRGIQLLNVALGGTLVQDVPSQVPNALQHYTHSLAPFASHTIDIEPGTLLAKLVGSAATTVNSYHHQAVAKVGEGLRVNARARDGVVEGVEAVDGRPVLGVQFHPEELAGSDAKAQVYFDWLMGEAAEYRHRK